MNWEWSGDDEGGGGVEEVGGGVERHDSWLLFCHGCVECLIALIEAMHWWAHQQTCMLS